MNKIWDSIRHGWALFALLPLAYFLLFGAMGWADTDQGFIPALAWRIQLGQILYLDFAYVRPPLTPYLHAGINSLLPENSQIWGMRIVFYGMMWTSVLMGLLSLKRLMKAHEVQLPLGWLGVLAFAFSVHNFPAMPWHTVDGIFFGSLGIFLLTHPKSATTWVLGLVVLGCAGLTKQPFALMFPLGVLALGLLQPLKKALAVGLIAATILGLMAWAVIELWLVPDFVSAMLAQTTGASSFQELIKTGVVAYIWPGGLLFAACLGLIAHAKRKAAWQEQIPAIAFSLLIGLALYAFAWSIWAFWKGESPAPKMGFYHALWFCGAVVMLQSWQRGDRRIAVTLLLMNGLSWASSLSWGYAFPALFALPGIAGLWMLANGLVPDNKALPKVLAAVALASLLAFFGLQQFPYRDSASPQLIAGAGTIYPKLNHIQTSQAHLEKLEEYRFLRPQYARMTVLPAMPAADYLTGRAPSIGIDWAHDAEIGAANMDKMIAQLQSLDAVLVELGRKQEAYSANAHYRSTLLKYVLEHWRPAAEGAYFQVYLPPLLNP